MTIDHILNILKKCPVCGGRIILDNIIFECEHNQCIMFAPGFGTNKVNVDIIWLTYNGFVYKYFDKEISVYNESDESEKISSIICNEEMVLELFSKPKNILKFFIVS